MDISTPTLWWIATGVAVAAELATGTFYLLMVALGLAAGAVAAHLGLALSAGHRRRADQRRRDGRVALAAVQPTAVGAGENQP